MTKTAPTRTLLLTVAFFALAIASSRTLAIPQQAVSAVEGRPGLSLLWQRSVDPLLNLSLSPQGEYVSLITADGRLVLWSAQTGKSKWAISGVTAHDSIVSDQLGAVLVYDDMNRLDRRLTIYRAPIVPGLKKPSVPLTQPQSHPETKSPVHGVAQATPTPAAPVVHPVRIYSRVLGGAIWDAAVSLDGATAACVTGDRKLHLITLSRQPSMTTLSVDGIGNDLEFAANNQFVAVGLWDNSGIETVDMAGRIRWSYLGAISRRYDVAVSPDSRRILSISYRNPNHAAPVLTLLNEEGAVLWTYPLDPDAYGATARLGANAEITYVSYTTVVRHFREIALERRLVALGPAGDVLWRQGGLFFKPTLLFVAPANNGVIVYDGVQTLYRIDQQGRVTRRDRLPGQLEYWTIDRARTRLITYTSDGQLTAYKVR